MAERAEAVPDMVRVGRPRSRVGIVHTINRKQDFHPALESGETPVSAIEYQERTRKEWR